jgi:hypothetical protein
VCIERDLEVSCLLEVQVFTSRRFLEAILKAIWSWEVHKSWIGAIWRCFEALDVQTSIVSLDLNH